VVFLPEAETGDRPDPAWFRHHLLEKHLLQNVLNLSKEMDFMVAVEAACFLGGRAMGRVRSIRDQVDLQRRLKTRLVPSTL
jgi:hypothetical protein